MNATEEIRNITEEVLIVPELRASLGIFAILAVLLSLALMLAIAVDPLNCLRSGTSFLSFNLMVSDFLCASTVFVSTIGNWSLGNGTILIFVCHFFAIGSCTFAFVLAVDRYFLVAHPIKYNQILCDVKFIIVCVATWLVALCFTLAFYFFEHYLARTSWEYHLIFIIIGGKLSLFAMTNVATIRNLKKLQANLKEHLKTSGVIQTHAEQKRLRSERKFFKIVFIMFLNYVLFVLPGSIYYNISIHFRQSGAAQIFSEAFFATIFFLILAMHSLIDPISYIAGIRKYRQSILELFLSKRS